MTEFLSSPGFAYVIGLAHGAALMFWWKRWKKRH